MCIRSLGLTDAPSLPARTHLPPKTERCQQQVQSSVTRARGTGPCGLREPPGHLIQPGLGWGTQGGLPGAGDF